MSTGVARTSDAPAVKGTATKQTNGTIRFSSSEPTADEKVDAAEEEKLELMRQDALLQRLVKTVREAKEAAEQALAFAQVSAGGG